MSLAYSSPSPLLWSCIHGSTPYTSSVETPMATEVQKQIHLYMITRKHNCWQYAEKDKEEVRKILACFAGMMQCFFTIAQNPENKQMVRASLFGILGHLVNAGRVIMRNGDIVIEDTTPVVDALIEMPSVTMITRK